MLTNGGSYIRINFAEPHKVYKKCLIKPVKFTDDKAIIGGLETYLYPRDDNVNIPLQLEKLEILSETVSAMQTYKFKGFNLHQVKLLKKAYDRLDEENFYAFGGFVQKHFL